MQMIDLAKMIAYWTLPPGIEQVVRRRFVLHANRKLERGMSVEDREILARNRMLHNRHQGERCFILASGPSIQQQDLKSLQGETSIAVSNFFVHPDYHNIAPKYYCIAPYHNPITEEGWRDWMSEMDNGIGAAIPFYSIADRLRNRDFFLTHDISYIKFGGDWTTSNGDSLDITAPIPSPQSVTIFALFVALYMGFSKIYLLGCDHDWILHLNESRHFYEEKEHRLVQSGYNEWFGDDLESYCYDYIRLWQQYKKTRAVAIQRGCEIFNATAGGLLDIFPRVCFDSLMSTPRISR